MKKYFVFLLIIALFVGSLFGSLNIDAAEYLLGPYDYVTRIRNCFDNFPQLPDLDMDFENVGFKETLQGFDFKFDEWEDIEVDGIADVPEAVVTFMNNVISYVKSFFKTNSQYFVRLWNNFKSLFHNVFEPITAVFERVVYAARNIAKYGEWAKMTFLAFWPLDWEAMVADDVNVKLPLWSSLVEDIIEHIETIHGNWRGGN